MQAGERVTVPHPDTIADGLRSPRPGELTFPVVQHYVEQVILVSDDEIRAAVKFLLLRLKILVEPSGAVPAAAVMFHKLPPAIRSVGVVLSGGNVDFEELAKYDQPGRWRSSFPPILLVHPSLFGPPAADGAGKVA